MQESTYLIIQKFASSILFWSILAIIASALLFYTENRIQKLNEKLIQNLFHLNEFMSGHNTMTKLKENNLNLSVNALRTSYLAFFAYTHDGKSPSQTEINQI